MIETTWYRWTDIADIDDDCDDGREVQFILDDGIVRTSPLDLFDYGFSDDGEYPIWHVLSEGESISLASAVKWRFVSTALEL